MTPAQKANRERFKKVVAEAKKLRKKNPKLTQAQAVKQAWAITYSKGTKIGAAKKAAPKKSAKKAAPKKAAKKAAPKKMAKHIDTKSHNVNIRVVSGLDKITRKGKKTTVHYSRISGAYDLTTYRGVRIEVKPVRGYGHYEIVGYFKNGIKKAITTDSTIYDWYNDDSNRKKHQMAKKKALSLLNRV